jgi:ketosteroid isomerase-like protein
MTALALIFNMNSKTLMAPVVAVALVIAAAVIASQGQPNSNSTPPEAQKAVLARLTEIQNAAQALDADKVFSFVLENDAGALAQNGKLFLTRKEALESTKLGFQRLQKVDYRFDQQHVVLLSPTVALATGEGSSSAALEDGRTLTTRFAQSVVFVLTNGEWKVFHAHRSFPPAT